jgi:hypothetical protein
LYYIHGHSLQVTDKRSIIHELCPGFNGPGIKLSDPKSAPVLLPGADRLSNPLRKFDATKNTFLPKYFLSMFFMCLAWLCNLHFYVLLYSSNSEQSFSSSSSTISLSSYLSLPDLTKPAGRNHKMICLKLKNVANGIFLLLIIKELFKICI